MRYLILISLAIAGCKTVDMKAARKDCDESKGWVIVDDGGGQWHCSRTTKR